MKLLPWDMRGEKDNRQQGLYPNLGIKTVNYFELVKTGGLSNIQSKRLKIALYSLQKM